MKKFFTLTMLLVVALTVNAQETYRKSWDFTKWSPTTVANLMTESAKGPTTGAWSDVEKATATEPTEASKDNCFWEVTAQGNASTPATLMANGEVIAELEGLGYTNTTARSLAIAVNYQQATAGELWTYHGASYLWLGSKTKNYFVIPHVAPGTTIKMGVESHKLSEARGVELYVGIGNSGTKLKDPEGNDVAIPAEYTDQTWLVPEDLTDTPNEDGTFDVTIRNTNGCHIYYITVGEGDAPQTEDAKKVAYLYNGDLDSDLSYIFLSGDARFEVTPVEMTGEVDYASLSEYEAVVLAPSIENPAALRSLIAFIPVVNLTASNYSALGLGINRETETNILTIADATNDIFEGLDETVEYEGAINGVILGEYFANDAVLAKADGVVAIHAHNPGRNAYYLIPSENASESVYMTLIPQAVLAAAKTKRDVVAVGTPTITVKQEDGASVVTIKAANSTKIFYTTDGTDPTEESTVYAEPFTVTEACTVKAFAIGDGYLNSEIAEKEVTIAVKAAAPSIAVAREAGKSTITLTTNEEVDMYFNFTGSSKVAESQKYTDPIELTEPTYITFLASGGSYLDSDASTEFVGIDGVTSENIRWDVVLHMGAEKEEWSEVGSDESRSSKVNYMFGKSAKSMYTDEQIGTEIVKDEEGNDVEVPVFKKVEPMEVTNVSGTWKAVSYGQVMTWENPTPGKNVGEVGTNCPEFASDHMPVNGVDGVTNYMLQFKGKVSGEPYNASIETVNPVAGPFDVIVYFNNGKADSHPIVNVEIKAEGAEEWTVLGELATVNDVRLMKRTKLSYEEAAPVYVRLAHVGGNATAQVFDIYIMNNGEESAKYSEAELAGVSEVKSDQRAKVVGIYNVNGVRTQQLTRGLNIVVGADGSVRKVAIK